ncbi:hypothetical protein [Pseudomonas fluorescens]|uniref:Uncharacterized protein n=1 Tax=Pseudomonas fluorescens TaxID=294 RepID=A0A5E7SJZ3_PSEFL|nr:hypothetical protein [Pseudomonas fluorescens]VVP86746.1 hypothetical protein PS941_01275 [Pseudomonas fluorescens]
MSQSTTGDNTVLKLYPPKIQGQTEPVIGARVGVSLVVYDLVADGEGAKVQIDPPLVGIWEPEDVVKLWLVNDTTLLSFTTIGDPNVPIFLRIPKNRLDTDRVNQLYYTVERNGGNVGTSEPPLTVLYNRIRPGLKDRFPDIDGHSELGLDLSDLIKQGVGKDFVSAPVCFIYPYCRAYDTITLKCNGEIQTFPVSKDQAPEPPNPGSEVPTTLCFTVEREFLDKAKRQNKVLNFSYTVTDQLLNGPDPDAVWSAAVAVNEDLDGTLLDKPILLERLEDFPGDDAGTIELEKLANNDLLLVILTKDDRFVVGYDVKATFIATIPGQDEQPVVVSGKVEADPFGAKKTCIFKVLNKDVILASSVRVAYELFTPNGDFVARSNIATATVTGAHMELRPASVQRANGNTLAPMNALTKLTIVVPQGTTLPTDLLSVSWIAEPGSHAEGTYISVPRLISEIGLNIDIAPALVAFCLGGKATVSNTITRGNGQPKPSDPFILNVQELPQAELLAPRLKEASNAGEGTELNLAELTPEGKMWFSGFPFNAVGQYVWLLFKGTNTDGSTYEKYIWAAPFAFVNEDWVKNGYFEATAPNEDLKGLKDGTPLIMEMWVAFGKSEDLGLAKRFLARTYIVSAFVEVRPAITGVKDSIRENIAEGGTTADSAIILSGTASPDQNIQLYDGASTIGPIIKVKSDEKWSQMIDGLTLKSYSFTAVAKYGSGLPSAPPRTLCVIDYVEEDFDELANQKIQNRGEKIETPLLTIEQLGQGGQNATSGTVWSTSNPTPGKFDGKVLVCNHMFHDGSAQISIKFKTTYKRLSFWMWTSSAGAPLGTIVILNNGVRVGEIKTPGAAGQNVTFQDRSVTSRFNEMQLYSFSGTSLVYQFDHIKLYK